MAEAFGAALKRYIAAGYAAPEAMRAAWHDVKVGRVERPRRRRAMTVQQRRAAMKATARGINPRRRGRRNPEAVCLGHVQGPTWRQEWYETASRHARARARELRALGYRVATSPFRGSVTPLGVLNLTLLDVRAGSTGDPSLERVPAARCEHMRRNPRRRRNPVAGFEAFDLEDRAGWERAIRTAGGLKVGRADRGEFAEVPGYLKGYKRGVAPDELAQMIAAERGLSGRQVERAMLRAFHGPRRRGRARSLEDYERLEREAIQAEGGRRRRGGSESRPRVGVGVDTFTLRPRSPFRGRVHFVANRRGRRNPVEGEIDGARIQVRSLDDLRAAGWPLVARDLKARGFAAVVEVHSTLTPAAFQAYLTPRGRPVYVAGSRALFQRLAPRWREHMASARLTVTNPRGRARGRDRGRARFCAERLEAPGHFDPRSFRTVTQRGHRVTVGCPTGHYDARRRRCTVGTRAQRILHPAGEGRCPIAGRELGKNPRRRRVIAARSAAGAWYVGVRRDGRLETFPMAGAPTRGRCPRFVRVVGPFSSRALAQRMAIGLGARRVRSNPPRLAEIYRRILEIKAVKGPRRVSHFPRTPFRHAFTRGGKVLGVKSRGRYALKRGDLVVRGRHPLWAPVEV